MAYGELKRQRPSGRYMLLQHLRRNSHHPRQSDSAYIGFFCVVSKEIDDSQNLMQYNVHEYVVNHAGCDLDQ